MGKLSQGILGAVSGRVGPVVAYECNGRVIVRSAPTEIHNPRTPRQQAGRGLFGAASRLARGMRAALEVGLRGAGAALHMSARNLFIRINRQSISLEDGEAEVDYSRVQVAQGALPGVAFGEVRREGRHIEVAFATTPTDNADEPPEHPAKATDYVYLYAYAPRWGEGTLSTPAQRYEGHVALELPTCFEGCEVQLYGFVWDRRGEASPSEWLGVEGAGELTEVAPEGVAAGVDVGGQGPLDVGGVVGGAAVEVEHGRALGGEGAVGAGGDAAVAGSAAVSGERGVVGVAIGGGDNLAEVDPGAKTGSDEQCVAANPS